MNFRYIAVEGNIGSGKTTLAERLAAYYRAQLILEAFAENPFLAKFYKDAKRYAFPLELSFLADRYHQLKEVLAGNLFHQCVISDYIFEKSKIFACINLSEDEFNLFQKMSDIMTLSLPKPELLIFLHTATDRLQANIKKRGRSYEQSISSEYLERVTAGYDNFMKYAGLKVLHVDMRHYDITTDVHFQLIIDTLETGKATSTGIFFNRQ